MSQAGDVVLCPDCERALQRDFAAERPAVQEFTAYESAAAGVPACVMKKATRRGKDWYLRGRRLNPRGFRVNPKTGGVLVGNRAEKRALLRERGLTDYGDARE